MLFLVKCCLVVYKLELSHHHYSKLPRVLQVLSTPCAQTQWLCCCFATSASLQHVQAYWNIILIKETKKKKLISVSHARAEQKGKDHYGDTGECHRNITQTIRSIPFPTGCQCLCWSGPNTLKERFVTSRHFCCRQRTHICNASIGDS